MKVFSLHSDCIKFNLRSVYMSFMRFRGLRCTFEGGKGLLNCDSQTPLCPREEQNGAMRAASSCASEAGYSAVRELR